MIRPTAFFLPPSIQSVPKLIISIDGIFTTDHNLGTMSSTIDSYEVARLSFRNIACDRPIYMKSYNKGIYISHDFFYHPVVTNFVSRQTTYLETIYRWNQVSPTGQLLKSIQLQGGDD